MNLKKLKRYVQDDRPQKLKRYVLSHDTDVNDVIVNNDKQGLLHYCALYGSGTMLKILLQLECEANHQDKDGNLPLHLAAQRALESSLEAAEEVYEELVVPLHKAYPMGQDVDNRQFVTARDLVQDLRSWLGEANKVTAKPPNIHPGQPIYDNEADWNTRLAEEAQAEGSGWSFFHEDDHHDHQGAESFEHLSDRLAREHAARSRRHPGTSRTQTRDRKRKSYDEPGSHDDSRPPPGEEDAERLRKTREEMKKRFKPVVKETPTLQTLLRKKQRYEEKFTHLLNHPPSQPLTFAQIPWPHASMGSVVSTLFCDLPDKAAPGYKRYLRQQRLRWHPDKFTQRFGDRLHPDHRDKILATVKAITQMLNKLAAE